MASTSSSKCRRTANVQHRASTSSPCSSNAACRPLPKPNQPGSMWRLCVQANTHGMARSACTPCRPRAPPAATDVHALDHIERRRRAEILEELALAEHQVRGRPRGSAPRWCCMAAMNPRAAGVARVRGRQRHGREGALERAHRNRPQAVALIDDLALLGQAQHAANRAAAPLDQFLGAAAAARRRAAAAVEDRDLIPCRAPPPAVASAPPAAPSATRRCRPACWCPNSRSPRFGDCRARRDAADRRARRYKRAAPRPPLQRARSTRAAAPHRAAFAAALVGDVGPARQQQHRQHVLGTRAPLTMYSPMARPPNLWRACAMASNTHRLRRPIASKEAEVGP
jgi:hypothetical protein